MVPQQLISTARTLVEDGKGLLAMDESTPTCDRRFAALGIPTTVDKRREYRELLVTAPGLAESISGAILVDETIHQQGRDGTPLIEHLRRAGIVPGIKVDRGAHELAGHPGERVTEGLDGLRGRLDGYRGLGARFAKWRAVIAIGEGIPSPGAIDANAHALARYAALCQEAGLVPIVEPEVLLDGAHTLERCATVSEHVLRTLFAQLATQRVDLRALLLKASMVLPGSGCPDQADTDQIADATADCLLATVPALVPGVVFLSGGQATHLATARLNAINRRHRGRAPWPLSFSYARALQQPTLELWRGDPARATAAQQALLHRARCNREAARGHYDVAQDQAAA